MTGAICTRIAHCTESAFQPLCDLMATITMLGDGAQWVESVYKYVAQRSACDVDLAELETRFDFKWALQTVGGRTTDPFFVRTLQEDVTNSFGTFLRDLDHKCRALPGLDPIELTPDADRDAMYACNTLYNRLAPLLSAASSTDQTLLEVAARARDELITAAMEKASLRLNLQAGGVRALQRLCAAARERRQDLSTILDVERDAVGYVVRFPPRILATELELAGVSLAELGGLLYPVEPFRMCGAVLEMSVTQWALAHYESVSGACVKTINELRIQAHGRRSWYDYASIALWHTAQNTDLIKSAMDTGGFGVVTPCPVAPHTHAFEGWVLAVLSTTQKSALRVARIATIVHRAVQLHLLRPRTVRGDSILAFLRRIGCERRFECERVMDREELLESMEVVDTRESNPTPVASPTQPIALRSPAQDASSLTLTVALQNVQYVPKSLQRDYVLIAIIRDLLSRATFVMIQRTELDANNVAVSTAAERGLIGISQACDRLKEVPTSIGEQVGCMVERFTKASLTMTIGFIMKDKIVAAMGSVSDGNVEYTTMPPWMSSTKGISFTRHGSGLLMTYMTTVMQKMQLPSGAVYANEWHISRSAKSHARRKQVPPAV
tara:strand:+ start:4490 stop:6322 length:1833 start_codon:yes stop_codon:yes gene_type:complete